VAGSRHIWYIFVAVGSEHRDKTAGGRDVPIYCKAYQVNDLKRFSGWASSAARDLGDDEICYLWEDFKLTRSCLGEREEPLVDISPAWKAFCEGELAFQVPEDVKGA
jgi:hypothetical protein